jgi:ADP-ribosylglycohydrolase
VLGAAVHAVVSHADFPSRVREAARHPTAAGACAAVAGGLAGAAGGTWAIPGDWLASLECRGLVDQVADDLLPVLDSRPERARIDRIYSLAGRYPGT